MNKKPGEKFKIGSHYLKIDCIFVEYIYPVLFTCIDEVDNLYIAACYCANAEKSEWIIADTSPKDIISLLKNGLTIRALFLKSKIWKATQYAKDDYPEVTEVTSENLDPSILPTEGEYMDADPDEFAEEIASMQQRNKHYCKKTVCSNRHSIISIFTLPIDAVIDSTIPVQEQHIIFSPKRFHNEVNYCV